MILKSEVYFFKNRWRFAVVQLGRLRQVIDWLIRRPARNKKDAYIQAEQALAHERAKCNDAR